MSQPTTAVLAIDKIEVEDGLNPRTRFDEDRLAELEASIRQDGLVTALTVVPGQRRALHRHRRRAPTDRDETRRSAGGARSSPIGKGLTRCHARREPDPRGSRPDRHGPGSR